MESGPPTWVEVTVGDISRRAAITADTYDVVLSGRYRTDVINFIARLPFDMNIS